MVVYRLIAIHHQGTGGAGTGINMGCQQHGSRVGGCVDIVKDTGLEVSFRGPGVGRIRMRRHRGTQKGCHNCQDDGNRYSSSECSYYHSGVYLFLFLDFGMDHE
jgi:hypothetical protein